MHCDRLKISCPLAEKRNFIAWVVNSFVADVAGTSWLTLKMAVSIDSFCPLFHHRGPEAGE